MSLARKAINFDLSTNALEQYFSNTAEAYSKIKQFMLQNGFEHRQYSGYVSKEAIKDGDVAILVRNLSQRFSWLYPCTQKFDVTDIGEQHDLMAILAGGASQEKQQMPYTKDTIDKQNAIKQKVAKYAKDKINKETPDKDIER